MTAKEFFEINSFIIVKGGTPTILKEDARTVMMMARNEVCKKYEDIYNHVEETLEAIIYDCSMLTSGNVSHKAPSIKAFAQLRLDYIRKRKDELKYDVWMDADKPFNQYPDGIKARGCNDEIWIKVPDGWKDISTGMVDRYLHVNWTGEIMIPSELKNIRRINNDEDRG